ncbi:MAG: biopolymer transporter ExbD [Planctomycetes bacterium]|nr:biopolymer transporter ExbD [Planctomycetota bacterium]
MKKKKRGSPGEVGFNYTPLIDVTFNIIIFFILTTEIAEANLAQVTPPYPADSVAHGRVAGENHCTVNIVVKNPDSKDTEGAGEAKEYQIDGEPIPLGDVERLSQEFKSRQANWQRPAGASKDAEFYIEVRGDERVRYDAVAPVLLAAAKAQIKKMTLTAKKKDD